MRTVLGMRCRAVVRKLLQDSPTKPSKGAHHDGGDVEPVLQSSDATLAGSNVNALADDGKPVSQPKSIHTQQDRKNGEYTLVNIHIHLI